jgi:amino-acid N-acetyltransferase
MEIIPATDRREDVIDLLTKEKLVVSDIPADLENFVIAVQDHEVLGTAGLEIYGEYGFLRSVAVRPDARNKGVAGKMIKQMETLASAKRLKEIYLLTETAPGYFEKKNYTRISRAEVPVEVQGSSEFSYACPQSAIVMKKTL